MYKIDRRGGPGGVQKSFSRTDPNIYKLSYLKTFRFEHFKKSLQLKRLKQLVEKES